MADLLQRRIRDVLLTRLPGKRADAQRAETDFYDLLKEVPDLSSSSVWSSVKRGISSDPRYDAVGSSSLREELFNGYIRKLASSSNAANETPEEAAERKLKERKAKEEASLRERQAKVREEQERVSKDVGKSRAGAGREEGERLFGSLLVDQVRETVSNRWLVTLSKASRESLPDLTISRSYLFGRADDTKTTWDEAARFLHADPRFNNPSLSIHDKRRLFDAHLTRIQAKRSDALHNLFASSTPSLDATYDSVYPKIVDDPVVKRLGLQGDALEDRWAAWRRSWEAEARKEFDVLLGENSFVEFWGRMRKKTLDEAALKVKEDEMEEGEGMGEGGAADLTALAKQIDLNEIKSVLRVSEKPDPASEFDPESIFLHVNIR